MVKDKPYNPYPNYIRGDDTRYQEKPGILYAWRARALQYIEEKDPLKTYRSVDENKVEWTWHQLLWDPVASLIGRELITEEEIQHKLIWKDKEEAAIMIKKQSDYHSITQSTEYQGSHIERTHDLEKHIVHTRVVNNYQPHLEVEGETLYERRTIFDMNYLAHMLTFGYIEYDPYKTRCTVPFRKEGYIAGEMRKEKPLKGPNIRGRYARDLRGDKDCLYEFTNKSDYTHLGSDMKDDYSNERGFAVIKNKFIDKEDLD